MNTAELWHPHITNTLITSYIQKQQQQCIQEGQHPAKLATVHTDEATKGHLKKKVQKKILLKNGFKMQYTINY